MATISNIKSDITSLNEYQLRELFNYIGEILTLGSSNVVLTKNSENQDLARVNAVLIVNLLLW